jgi:glycine oxidase
LRAALDAVPAIADLALAETWAGLRPGSPDGLPFLGETEIAGYHVAAGHYRNGILLAPVTAVAIADALEGKNAGDLLPFSPRRMRHAAHASAAKETV